jgi:hypothetical protein
MYAHTLDEQNVEQKRKNVYDIIIHNEDLSTIDLKTDYELYYSLLELTKVCDLCINNKCTGGYNCKYGVCLEKLCICIKDLNYGNCTKCELVHLTTRGLVPFYKTIETKYDNNILINRDDDNISELSLSDSDDDINEFDVSIFSKYNQK